MGVGKRRRGGKKRRRDKRDERRMVSSFLCCLPLSLGVAFAVLFDLACTAFFGLSYFDAKDASSDGYEHLSTGLGAFACVLAATAAFGVLSFLDAVFNIGFRTIYTGLSFVKILSGIALVVVFAFMQQDICFEAKAVTWTLG